MRQIKTKSSIRKIRSRAKMKLISTLEEVEMLANGVPLYIITELNNSLAKFEAKFIARPNLE